MANIPITMDFQLLKLPARSPTHYLKKPIKLPSILLSHLADRSSNLSPRTTNTTPPIASVPSSGVSPRIENSLLNRSLQEHRKTSPRLRAGTIPNVPINSSDAAFGTHPNSDQPSSGGNNLAKTSPKLRSVNYNYEQQLSQFEQTFPHIPKSHQRDYIKQQPRTQFNKANTSASVLSASSQSPARMLANQFQSLIPTTTTSTIPESEKDIAILEQHRSDSNYPPSTQQLQQQQQPNQQPQVKSIAYNKQQYSQYLTKTKMLNYLNREGSTSPPDSNPSSSSRQTTSRLAQSKSPATSSRQLISKTPSRLTRANLKLLKEQTQASPNQEQNLKGSAQQLAASNHTINVTETISQTGLVSTHNGNAVGGSSNSGIGSAQAISADIQKEKELQILLQQEKANEILASKQREKEEAAEKQQTEQKAKNFKEMRLSLLIGPDSDGLSTKFFKEYRKDDAYSSQMKAYFTVEPELVIASCTEESSDESSTSSVPRGENAMFLQRFEQRNQSHSQNGSSHSKNRKGKSNKKTTNIQPMISVRNSFALQVQQRTSNAFLDEKTRISRGSTRKSQIKLQSQLPSRDQLDNKSDEEGNGDSEMSSEEELDQLNAMKQKQDLLSAKAGTNSKATGQKALPQKKQSIMYGFQSPLDQEMQKYQSNNKVILFSKLENFDELAANALISHGLNLKNISKDLSFVHNDLPGLEWIQKVRGIRGNFHAHCIYFKNQQQIKKRNTKIKLYRWEKVKVLSYNQSTSKFRVQRIDNAREKDVSRNVLAFRFEQMENVIERIEIIQKKGRFLSDERKFQAYLDQIEDSQVSSMPRDMKLRIFNKVLGGSEQRQQAQNQYSLGTSSSGTAATAKMVGTKISNKLNCEKILANVIEEVDKLYRNKMKEQFVIFQMDQVENQQHFLHEAQIDVRTLVAPVYPVKGCIFETQKNIVEITKRILLKRNSFLRMDCLRALVNIRKISLAFTQEPVLDFQMDAFTFPIDVLLLVKRQVIILRIFEVLYLFIVHLFFKQERAERTRIGLITRLRERILNEITDRIIRSFGSFERNKESFLRSKLCRYLKRLEFSIQTSLESDLLISNCNSWIQFLQSFTFPSLNILSPTFLQHARRKRQQQQQQQQQSNNYNYDSARRSKQKTNFLQVPGATTGSSSSSDDEDDEYDERFAAEQEEQQNSSITSEETQQIQAELNSQDLGSLWVCKNSPLLYVTMSCNREDGRITFSPNFDDICAHLSEPLRKLKETACSFQRLEKTVVPLIDLNISDTYLLEHKRLFTKMNGFISMFIQEQWDAYVNPLIEIYNRFASFFLPEHMQIASIFTSNANINFSLLARELNHFTTKNSTTSSSSYTTSSNINTNSNNNNNINTTNQTHPNNNNNPQQQQQQVKADINEKNISNDQNHNSNINQNNMNSNNGQQNAGTINTNHQSNSNNSNNQNSNQATNSSGNNASSGGSVANSLPVGQTSAALGTGTATTATFYSLSKLRSPQEIKEVITKIQSDIFEAKTLACDTVNTPLFKVDVAPCKLSTALAGVSVMKCLLRVVYFVTTLNIKHLYDSFDKLTQKISHYPKTEEDLVVVKVLIEGGKNEIDKLSEKIGEIHSYICLMEDFLFYIDPETQEKFWMLYTCPQKVRKSLQSSRSMVESQEKRFKDALEKERYQLQLKIEKIAQDFQTLKNFNNYQLAKDYSMEAQSLNDHINDASYQRQQINKREVLLSLPNTKYFQLESIKEQSDYFIKMWELAFELQIDRHKWIFGSLMKISFPSFKQRLIEYDTDKELLRIKIAELTEDKSVLKVLSEIQKDIDLSREVSWMVEYLTTEAMVKQPQFFRDLFKECNLPAIEPNDDMSLKSLIDIDLVHFRDQIREVSERAENLYNTERQLSSIEDRLKETPVELKPFRDGHFLFGNFAAMFAILEDQAIVLADVKDSGRMKLSLQKTQELEAKLIAVKENLIQIQNYQEKFMLAIEKICAGSTLATAKRFLTEEDFWKHLIKEVKENNSMFEIDFAFDYETHIASLIFILATD